MSESELIRSTVRGMLDATADDEIGSAFAAAGFAELLHSQPNLAQRILHDEVGRGLVGAAAMDLVVVEALGLDIALTRVAYPARRGPVDGRHVPSHVIVGGVGASVEAIVIIDDTDDVRVASRGAIEPERALIGIDPSLDAVSFVPEGNGAEAVDPSNASTAVAAGRRALSGCLIGSCAVMLNLARGHADERMQFGTTIGSFQAIRHRLADAHVAIVAAEAALDDADHSGGALEAVVAKGLAGRAGRVVAAHAQQVLAAVGFTAEHAFPGYVRRSLAFDALLGSEHDLAARLGASILATGHVPRTVADGPTSAPRPRWPGEVVVRHDTELDLRRTLEDLG